jgi:hypothetical protein
MIHDLTHDRSKKIDWKIDHTIGTPQQEGGTRHSDIMLEPKFFSLCVKITRHSIMARKIEFERVLTLLAAPKIAFIRVTDS